MSRIGLGIELDVLAFRLAGQRYGVPARDVREVVRATAVVALPKAPPAIEGVIDLRGVLVPVLDVRARFRLPPRAAAPSDHVVVAAAGPRLVAMRADDADGLVRLAPGDIEDPAAAVPAVGYVAGVARLPDGLLLIHDVAEFLSDAEAADVDAALRAAPPDAASPDGPLLTRRAQALARRPEPRAARRPQAVDVVSFTVGDERYAIPSRFVRELVPIESMAAVPGLPRYWRGIAAARGQLIGVVDVRRLLGGAAAEGGPASRMLVLGTERAELALAVDTVDGLTAIAEASLRPLPERAGSVGGGLLRGITDDGFVLIDGARLLADERLFHDHLGSVPTSGEEPS
jgi:purine-binding chemotaxis protein CheW